MAVTRSQRGDISLATLAVATAISVAVPFVVWGVTEAIDYLKRGNNPQQAAAPESPIVPGPAPPDNACAQDAYSSFGLRWNTGGTRGWSIDGHLPPDLGVKNYRQELRIYKAVIEARVVDARKLWIERDCHKPQEPIQPPEPERSPEPTIAINVSGTYVLTLDDTRTSYGQPDALDQQGCAGRRVPPDMTVAVNGTVINLTLVDTPGTAAYTANGTYDPGSMAFSATYPDGARFLTGRFFVSGDSVLLQDGFMYTGNCTLGFAGEKRS